MYCAYPVPGVGSSSLMYYYNGKTVRGRLCSPRRGGASLRRASSRPGATCWRAGAAVSEKGCARRAGTARKSAVRSAAGPGPREAKLRRRGRAGVPLGAAQSGRRPRDGRGNVHERGSAAAAFRVCESRRAACSGPGGARLRSE